VRRELTLDDIESLAVGAWILGTGGGGNPYLPLLNMRALYKEGYRAQLIQAADLADDDLVAGAGGMGAPLVGIERMGDARTLTRAVQAMEAHIKRRFTALMSVEIGGGNGVRPFMAAALMNLPVVDSDPMGRAYPEGQMTSTACDRASVCSRSRIAPSSDGASVPRSRVARACGCCTIARPFDCRYQNSTERAFGREPGGLNRRP